MNTRESTEWADGAYILDAEVGRTGKGGNHYLRSTMVRSVIWIRHGLEYISGQVCKSDGCSVCRDDRR